MHGERRGAELTRGGAGKLDGVAGLQFLAELPAILVGPALGLALEGDDGEPDLVAVLHVLRDLDLDFAPAPVGDPEGGADAVLRAFLLARCVDDEGDVAVGVEHGHAGLVGVGAHAGFLGAERADDGGVPADELLARGVGEAAGPAGGFGGRQGAGAVGGGADGDGLGADAGLARLFVLDACEGEDAEGVLLLLGVLVGGHLPGLAGLGLGLGLALREDGAGGAGEQADRGNGGDELHGAYSCASGSAAVVQTAAERVVQRERVSAACGPVRAECAVGAEVVISETSVKSGLTRERAVTTA